MSQPEHTPGPWKTEYSNVYGYNGLYITRDVRGDGHVVARMDDSTCGSFGREKAANAQLIATAPELLESLRHFTQVWEWLKNHEPDRPGRGDFSIAYTEACAIIAKAEGRTL